MSQTFVDMALEQHQRVRSTILSTSVKCSSDKLLNRVTFTKLDFVRLALPLEQC